MTVSIPSLYSGKLNSMDLPITRAQLERWYIGGEAISVAMPGLSADQVQFLVSGMTPEERIAHFGPLAR